VNKSYTATVVEDPENLGEMFLPFPSELIDQVGWKEGDTLVWEANNNGTFTIKKKEESCQ
jgi:hypothetical protein